MHDWKKDEQKLYVPPVSPHVIHVPKQLYFVIDGGATQEPNDVTERIHTLIALSDAVKHMPDSGYSPPGFTDYTIYPLERLIHSDAEAPGSACNCSLMIRQPDFIDNETIDRAFTLVHREQNLPHLPEVAFEEFEDALSVQMRMQNERTERQAGLEAIDRFLLENDWKRRTGVHREIYCGSSLQASDEIIYRVFVEEVQ
ncbi:hypothetical protein [Planococcus sp. ISL-109]|uniref:hypothetical protein n=1 Tax=Planococcus sp. ISL-109 TaxID=2819166 RepID=UPI001BEB4056|nr:hypothetical protein [Planococcus sp. ISL-109]MBT2583415.1 hypothetical protein [Planococcus sp. ISL-109]